MKSKSATQKPSFAESMFRDYGAQLHRYLLRRLRNAEDAADLAQEVYMQLVRMDNADFVRSPRAYLLRIAANVASDFQRGASFLRQRLSFDSEAVERLAEHPAEIGTDELASRLLNERELKSALERLPAAHQAAFVLKNRDGYSYEEIARRLKVSPRKVERLLAEAKVELQRLLGEAHT